MALDSEIVSIKNRFGIVGNSPRLINAIKVAMQVAPTEMTVLITGESGSGKESFSKIIHHLSGRKHGSFIAVNCGAIPEGTIDSELFGHEKGAFTGAQEMRKGYFEVTNGGTLFLDEIGEMPLGTQSRLLRILENGEFIKVGSSKVQKTDVRVVTATNKDLMEAVEKGKFREDLYYRLNTVPIYVPPLRERGDDVLLLFKRFATDFAEKYRTKPIFLDEEAQEALKAFRFPGNIRQLKNLVERISVLEYERKIDIKTLKKYLPQEESNLPAIYKREGEHQQQFSERDILYKVLFDMRRDMHELKGLVYQLLQNDHYGDEIIEKHQNLFKDVKEDAFDYTSTARENAGPRNLNERYLITNGDESLNNNQEEAPVESAEEEPEKNYSFEEVEDIPHATEADESLSLEKNERDLIVRALRKNNNKRKQAAKDLKISERTLYRKIKQYEIE